jgi:DNA polymerase delta subunit 1
MAKDDRGEVSILRMFGVNSKGNSLVVHVFNFKPYFYIQVPTTMHLEDAHMPALLELLNAKLQGAPGEVVTEVEIVYLKSIMHYAERTSKFVKVSTVLPKHVGQLRSHIEKGINFNGSTFWTTTYESNLPHSLRFMIDNEMVGMSWVEVPAGSYAVRPKSHKKTTN